MDAKPQSKAFRVLLLVTLALIVVGGFVAYLIWQQMVNSRTASARLDILQAEFAKIAPPAEATPLRYGSRHKTDQGDVGSDYNTRMSYDEIRMHYHRELNARGWSFVKQENVKIWGRDFGGKQVFYCKAGNTATLEYAGAKESEFGWTYSFGLSWGLFNECTY